MGENLPYSCIVVNAMPRCPIKNLARINPANGVHDARTTGIPNEFIRLGKILSGNPSSALQSPGESFPRPVNERFRRAVDKDPLIDDEEDFAVYPGVLNFDAPKVFALRQPARKKADVAARFA
jgi:hypothetical protein